MIDIKGLLKKQIADLTGEIQKLQTQKSALETALQALDGEPVRTRRRVPARVARRAATGPARRKRGANQERVLSALSKEPRRLSDVASKAGLTMSGAGAVLRALIGKGTAVKGSRRGTYLLKKTPTR
jgi:chromosome segregation ATPase